MAVTLLVEREVIPGAQGEVTILLRELRSAATLWPGFISGRSVVDAFNPTIFMTISHWSSMAVWESWEKNPRRTKIVDRIRAELQAEPTVRLWLDDEDAPPGAA